MTDASTTRFVVLGHIYETAIHVDRPSYFDVLEKLVEEINDANPDYVFILGDITGKGDVQEEWDILIEHVFEKVDAPIYIAPGNHEFDSFRTPDGKQHWKTKETNTLYMRNIGYLYNVVETPHANFLLATSHEPTKDIIAFLNTAFSKISSAKPTFLMSHARLWRNQEIMDNINGEIDFGFAGDVAPDFGTGFVNGVQTFDVGLPSRGANQPVYFAVGEIGPKKILRVTPMYIELDRRHPWYIAPRGSGGRFLLPRSEEYWEEIYRRSGQPLEFPVNRLHSSQGFSE